MKHIFLTSLIALALLGSFNPVHAAPLDGIVAVVGDDVVLESELQASINQIRARAGSRVDQMPGNVLRSRVLDRLIMTRLQAARANERGITVSDTEIDQGMARIAKQNGMNRQQFMRAVANDGMDPQTLRAQVREELLVSKLRRQEVMKKVVVTEDDIDRYLENQSLREDGDTQAAGGTVMVQELELRHILLQPNEIRGDQRTQDLARQIRERLKAGDDFAALAREYSDDNATANQGGSLGWVRPDQFESATQRQLADLKIGQVSRVFQTREGYEIIKLQDRRQKDKTLEARRDRARAQLGKQKAADEGQLWLRKLRDEAYVDIRMQGYQPENDQ